MLINFPYNGSASRRLPPASPPAAAKGARASAQKGDPLEFFDQIDELFQRYKDAYIAYRQAVDDVAQRTGCTVSSVGHKISAEKRRRSIARSRAERVCGEPLEDVEWYNLM